MTVSPRGGDNLQGLHGRLLFRLSRAIVDPTAILPEIRASRCDLLAAVVLERSCRELRAAGLDCDHAYAGLAGPHSVSACSVDRMIVSLDLFRTDRSDERQEDAYALHLSAAIAPSGLYRPRFRFFSRRASVPPSESDLVHWAKLRSTIEEFLNAQGASGLVWDDSKNGGRHGSHKA